MEPQHKLVGGTVIHCCFSKYPDLTCPGSVFQLSVDVLHVVHISFANYMSI